MNDKRIPSTNANVAGMLYVVDVKMVDKITRETTRQKLLMVGCEAKDIDRKLKWFFDQSKFSEFAVKNTQKVREKIHTLSTTVTQEISEADALVKQGREVKKVHQSQGIVEKYDPNLYAVGITTTMLAKDEAHALRKVANAILSREAGAESHSGPSFSDDSTITVEHIPLSSGYAQPRDVSDEINGATFVRG